MLINLNFLPKNNSRVYFCGMAGASMSALAALTEKCGHTALGSDISPTKEAIQLFRSLGIPLFFSHDEINIHGCDALVYTAAVKWDNPEIAYAIRNGIPVYTRSQYLGMISSNFPITVAVAGTHGKSTVTHMIADILEKAQTSPTLLAGARSVKSNSAFRIGEGDTLVCEACEYNRSFLDIKPTVAVILNIEKEHTDTYPKLSNAEDAYIEFAKSSTYCVLNYDCSSCRRIGKRLQAYGVKIKYFSMYNENTDAYCSNYKITTGRASFDIIMKTHIVQDIKLSVVGSHNAANALASALAASLCNASAASIQDALSGFKGIKRRFEYVGSVKGADVYDDYAHHPTEIKATLKAASTLGYERIFCAFQPHTYSRTSEFFSEFASAFDCCDEVIFSDIYAAREKNIYGVSSKALAASAKNGIYIKDFSEIQKYLFEKAKKGTLIITMGAGRMNEVAYALTENGFQGKD